MTWDHSSEKMTAASSRQQHFAPFFPLLKAYGLAYASTTGPRLLALILIIVKKRPNVAKNLSAFYSILSGSIGLGRFPTFCATLVGGSTFLQGPLQLAYDYLCISTSRQSKKPRLLFRSRTVVPRFVAAFVSAWASLQLLNLPKTIRLKPEQTNRDCPPEVSDVRLSTQTRPEAWEQSVPLRGRTIDLTLFAITRAVETVVVNVWRRRVKEKRTSVSLSISFISHYADAAIFALSSGTVMWSWFYDPDRLPRAYNKWIGEAAQVDPRLIEVLRRARAGNFVYGEDKGEQARLLQSMCKDYDWPSKWGDPEKTIPIPCEMVHMGTGPNCHWHAAVRFARTFKFAFATNLPLQLLVKVLAKRQYSLKAVKQACREAVQSSTFLGAFVALMYYGICLSRTLVGPKLFSHETISRQKWDSGLCVRAACIICGWSILLDAEKRRQELAMFVAPRALATLLPRTYEVKYFWRERAAFALSTAAVFTMAQEDSRYVRGMFGKLLNGVLR